MQFTKSIIHVAKSKKWQSIILSWFLVVLFIPAVTLPAIAQNDKSSATEPFLPPSGTYAVGMHEFLWVDKKRDEPFTKDPNDRRHLLARVWYPAEVTTGKEKAPYVLDINEYPEKSIYRRGQNIKTNAVIDAPIAKNKAPFPVLLYQPGGGTARFTATFLAEQLASHGYVVLSCDHPGFSETIMFPDGYRFQADTFVSPKESGNFRDNVLKSWEWLGKDVFPTWVADATYALDKITEMNRTTGDFFYQKLDLSRIGMTGWSFGGAAAMQMSRIDPRVKAVVD
jgi:predicted dienelactone hydrolase